MRTRAIAPTFTVATGRRTANAERIGRRPGRRSPSAFFSTLLEVDDDLAVYVPAGLKLDRGADLLDREA
jgi:hypothetical protein